MRVGYSISKHFLSILLSLNGVTVFPQTPKRPTFIFIVSDGHAYQAVSAYGSKLIHTTNMDRLAKQGAKREKSYLTSLFTISGNKRQIT
jgi:hypothetical protein